MKRWTFVSRMLLLLSGGFIADRAEAQAPIDTFVFEATNLSSSPGYSQEVDLAFEADGTLHFAWDENPDGVGYRRRPAGAETFDPSRVVLRHSDRYVYWRPSLAAANGTLHMAAGETDAYLGLSEIVYTRTADGGKSTAALTHLSRLDGVLSHGPTIRSGWGLGVVWTDSDSYATGASGIGYTQSVDGGQSFAAPRLLSSPAATAMGPTIALAGPNRAFVAWMEVVGGLQPSDHEEYIVFTRSTDGGITFEVPRRISAKRSKVFPPKIAVGADGTLHLAWTEVAELPYYPVLYARSHDEGQTFTTPVVMSDTSPRGIVTDVSAAPDGTVAVGWIEGHPGYPKACRFRLSQDHGSSFSPVQAGADWACLSLEARSARELHIGFVAPPSGNDGTPTDVFHAAVDVLNVDSGARGFYPLSPCRVVDTRGPQAPSLFPGIRRIFLARGVCGIPDEALAVAANVTAILPASAGHVTAFASGGDVPRVSTTNFNPGATRANSAVLRLGRDGSLAILPTLQGGPTDLAIDVTGYFR